jgi:4,5-dihydroxyphthalate decarboxylase
VRKSVVEERPSILVELCEAFDQAKQSAYYLLQNERMTALPLMRPYLDETVALFGNDPWPYGTEGRNRAETDRFLAYALDQGLIHKRLTTDDLFQPPVRDFKFQSRMIEGGDLGGTDSLYGYLPIED